VLGGMQLTVIGVMGEYLWRAVEEARNRPLYVIRDVQSSGPDSNGRPPGGPRQGRRAGPYARLEPPVVTQQAASAREGSITG
jgi:dolichol-phosphate mannosyltransferase